jgi:molybdopterin converting factor small subunit
MTILRIPTPLRPYTEGNSEIEVQADNVAGAMQQLIGLYPTLKPHLYNGDGQLRPYVNLYLNEDNIKDLQGLDTPVAESDRLMLIPSIAGGSLDAP